MKAILCAAALAALATPAAAQTSAYDEAIAARLAGRNDEAIARLTELTRQNAQDADVWLNLGLAYAAERRFDEADRALATALRIAPAYADAQVAYARVAYYRGDFLEAERRLAAAQSSEAEDLRRQIAAARAAPADRPWRVDATASYSRLSAGLEPWRAASLYVGRQVSPGASLTVGWEHTDRFGREDEYFELSGAHRFDGWSSYLAVGGTPQADHRPELAVRAGAEGAGARLGGGWSARFVVDAAFARFAAGNVRSVQPGVVFDHAALSLTARAIGTLDERDDFRSGYTLRGEWRAAPRLRLLAGWADAPESSEGVTVEVKAVSAGVAFDLDEATALRLDVVNEDRGAYERDEAVVSLTRRF